MKTDITKPLKQTIPFGNIEDEEMLRFVLLRMLIKNPNYRPMVEFIFRKRGVDFDDKYSHTLNPDYREPYDGK